LQSTLRTVSSEDDNRLRQVTSNSIADLLNPNVNALDDEKDHPTLDQLTASSRNKAQKNPSSLQSAIEHSSQSAAVQKIENEQAVSSSPVPGHSSDPTTGGAADLEAEADSEGAFNPVTGEINWDCPCLGGMAYGPCGDEFRAAFSCFVYSNEEPKGMECIDKFQGMQDCFKAHPEVYKGELEDDEALDGELAQEREELKQEIAERRSQVEQGQGQQRQRNLLDEAEPVLSSNGDKAPAKKTNKKESAGSSSGPGSKTPTALQSSSFSDTPQPEAKTETSQKPAEFSSDREAQNGAPSQTISEPMPKGTDANARPESDTLVPKAAHDATGASSEDTQ